ncbi:hypothetical protein [Mycolicibacterium peregrinum]|nr:hypothetical protein [Mycolicibacterium peregrinum]
MSSTSEVTAADTNSSARSKLENPSSLPALEVSATPWSLVSLS